MVSFTLLSIIPAISLTTGLLQEHSANLFPGTLKHLGLTSDEIHVIFGDARDAIESSQPKQDCFLTATNAIRERCQDDYMLEDERVFAAISMTMCELATAKHHSPPLECASFMSNSLLRLDERLSVHQSQRDCVEALSRSTQFWSSYSGYLREIPQLCFAFGRWKQNDLARDVYRNATVEKIALLQHLSKRETEMGLQVSLMKGHISELHNEISDLATLKEDLHISSGVVHNHIKASFDDLVSAHIVSFKEYKAAQNQKDTEHLQQVNESLTYIRDLHTQNLFGLVFDFRSTLQEQIEPIFSDVRTTYNLVVKLRGEVSNEWVKIFTQMNQLLETLAIFRNNIDASNTTLQYIDEQVVRLFQKQQEATIATSNLHDQIVLINAQTHAEMEKINSTAYSIRSNLTPPSSGNYGFLAKWLFDLIVQSFYRDNQHPDTMLSLKVIMTVLDMICFVGRGIASGAASLLVVFYTLRRQRQDYPIRDGNRQLRTESSSFGARRVVRYRVSRIPSRLCNSGC